MTDLDKKIEHMKNTMKTVVDLLKDLEEIRHEELKSLTKRVTTLEHQVAIHIENKNKGVI